MHYFEYNAHYNAHIKCGNYARYLLLNTIKASFGNTVLLTVTHITRVSRDKAFVCPPLLLLLSHIYTTHGGTCRHAAQGGHNHNSCLESVTLPMLDAAILNFRVNATAQTLANADEAALERWRTSIAKAANRTPSLATLRGWSKALRAHLNAGAAGGGGGGAAGPSSSAESSGTAGDAAMTEEEDIEADNAAMEEEEKEEEEGEEAGGAASADSDNGGSDSEADADADEDELVDGDSDSEEEDE